MATSPNTVRILNYLKEVNNQNVTADDVAEALGLTKKSVIGSFNSFVKKNIGYRVEDEVVNEDGTKTTIKYLKLNDEGMAFTFDAPAEE